MESIPISSVSLRQRGKARRQADIVAAAAALWRERGIENVSLSEIAARAEVAPQTVYNLIGGLDAIGFAVIKVALERLDDELGVASSTGIELALDAARISSGLYTADERLYRQVLVRIPRVLFEGTHLGRDTADTAIRAMQQAWEAGEIRRDVDPERLGRTMYVNYLGALYDWACGDSSDADFRTAAEVAVLAPAAACAAEPVRPRMTERLIASLSSDAKAIAVGEL
ncbi:TetR/AcrR family transcriptional regulator [Cupriavidus basilensis]|uniref:TetR/AcrR family transcriptional regulator n=1 Tax=Cupriavidus basilensis TaxID=68895 RepID=A0ABT6ATJ7_9BURK|nr:TetR/AcrR family transcriptional regulator [Cupriavidus basilensis]MDF3835708.1 TetR/AcrR family transcriptional regulator [Cupriavidus basilensis]